MQKQKQQSSRQLLVPLMSFCKKETRRDSLRAVEVDRSLTSQLSVGWKCEVEMQTIYISISRLVLKISAGCGRVSSVPGAHCTITSSIKEQCTEVLTAFSCSQQYEREAISSQSEWREDNRRVGLHAHLICTAPFGRYCLLWYLCLLSFFW